MRLYGFNKVFDCFCEINKADVGFSHDIGKVRDKFTEILDATGIDKALLKTIEKMEAADGSTLKGNSYIFPEDSIEFCALAINKYTTKDFKNLRSANFRDTAIEEVQFLIDGLSSMLVKLGVSHEVLLQQYNAMERRMHYKIRLSEKALYDELKKSRSRPNVTKIVFATLIMMTWFIFFGIWHSR